MGARMEGEWVSEKIVGLKVLGTVFDAECSIRP